MYAHEGRLLFQNGEPGPELVVVSLERVTSRDFLGQGCNLGSKALVF
jgi:hypothetical protein